MNIRKNYQNKPKLTSRELVKKLKYEKGILFNIMDEVSAENYLREHNNYFRTCAYRKNYLRYQAGPNKQKYIRLEFSYLCEISNLDMHLRGILLRMCLDVEHALKVSMLADLEYDQNEDGYAIVDDFLAINPIIKAGIAHASRSSFTSGLINRYFTISQYNHNVFIKNIDCSVWALAEIVTFGDFIRLYNFYYERCGCHEKKIDKGIANPIRMLRNACSHNNCLLFDLREKKQKTHPSATVSQFVARIPGIGEKERKKKLSCRPLFEICCLLYAEQKYVTEQLRVNQIQELKNFVYGRLYEHPEIFRESQIISSAFDFLRKMVDACS